MVFIFEEKSTSFIRINFAMHSFLTNEIFNGRSFYGYPFMGVLVAAVYFSKILQNVQFIYFNDVIKKHFYCTILCRRDVFFQLF